MNLTPHFPLHELTFSINAKRLGIDNLPTVEHLENLKKLALVLEDVRELLGNHPITITSGYRCKELNDKTPGSSTTSYHIMGLAADFICPGYGKPLDVAKKIASSNIKYDQLINEGGDWVHLGLRPGTLRMQQLSAKFPGPVWYPGLVEV